jgi:hypothetical protein
MNLREQLEKRRALYLAAASAIDQTLAAMAALDAPAPTANTTVSTAAPQPSAEAGLFGGGHADPA